MSSPSPEPPKCCTQASMHKPFYVYVICVTAAVIAKSYGHLVMSDEALLCLVQSFLPLFFITAIADLNPLNKRQCSCAREPKSEAHQQAGGKDGAEENIQKKDDEEDEKEVAKEFTSPSLGADPSTR